MRFSQLDIKGLWLIEPKRFGDDRGYFAETFRRAEFEEATGANGDFIQDNESVSRYGVVRGLHFQRGEFWQAKIVRVSRGAVLDVAVDLRAGSSTFGRYVAVELTADNGLQLYIPRGFAHGFAVLSDLAVFQYKCDEFYHPEADGGISIHDDSLGIDWRIDPTEAILSDKDTKHALLKDFNSPFDINIDLYCK